MCIRYSWLLKRKNEAVAVSTISPGPENSGASVVGFSLICAPYIYAFLRS